MKFAVKVIGALAILTVLAGCALTAVGLASGWRAFVVRTGSMAPGIRPGALVFDAPAKTVRPGEVITFARVAGTYTTHRVVEVTKQGIETKGDANPSPDYGYVKPSEVAGRVVAVLPIAGYVIVYASHPLGIATVVLLLLATWFAWGALSGRGDRQAQLAALPLHARREGGGLPSGS